jgi:hypothetical protein
MSKRKPYISHYLVVTEFDKIVHSTQDIDEAKKEAAEWAEHDDIWVGVYDSRLSGESYELIYEVDGYAEAVEMLYA